ncbi:S8 family serine peptidase [Halobacteriovorax sp. GFR7]|uniref:S8 family serine peptidase n=1 Tax=unclassified Halobacteriovorax TaxID=2639665 RepID=UPI00370FAC1F
MRLKAFLAPAVVSAMALSPLAADYVPGELIVKLKKDVSVESFFGQSLHGSSLDRRIELTSGDLYVVKFNESLVSIDAIAKQMNERAEVEYAEPNFIYEIVKPIVHTNVLEEILSYNTSSDEGVYYTPADEKFGQLWGLKNTGSNAPRGVSGVEGADVDALRAWEITQGDRAIKIAVIDTGIDYNHPDLRDQMWTNEGEIPGNGIDDDGNGYVDDIHGYDFANNDGDPMDGHSHGTHCAGTIGASHNAIGVAGVMRDVQFVGIKFLTDSGSGSTEAAIKSIDYATKIGVDIMSNSWGGGGRSEALKEAIERANEAGIVFTAAAGNSSTDNDSKPHYPSNYNVDNVISVAATTAADELASFSCYGRSTVHIGAPGHEILSTVKGGRYASYSGTSMATPHVSGVIGLFLSENKGLTPLEIRNKVMVTSDPVAALRGKTINAGRINAYNLLTDTVPERNEPNPEDWETVNVASFESEHPYLENQTLETTYTVEGAKFMRVRVRKFDLENRYDFIEVRDARGVLVEKITGSGENYTSFFAEGDTLKLIFKSDRSVQKWGFAIDQVDVQY